MVADWLLVCAGALVGAPARYLADRAVQRRHDGVFPWGTLAVNIVGSLVLGTLVGLAAGHHVPSQVVLLVGTGFCGTLTTFSTFGYETQRLFGDGAWPFAALNIAASLAAGLAAVGLGQALGGAW